MGRKLFQIEALISFGNVSKGEKGGYIEKEENLSQVFGNAWVFGDAWVYGNARVSPINVIGLIYNITILDTHIQIGCEFHSADEWFKFKDEEISAMHTDALEWWKVYKPLIQMMYEEHAKKVKETVK